ncbi:MAG: alpha/beta fold hydrolase [Desulfobacterales bacterium]|nr:MAG: alpha/beta fold hydrolase [Desulfobacterales bacterium]
MTDTRVFIHGLLGSSRGTKASFFRETYPDMIIEDFRGSLEQRMEKLNNILAQKRSLIIIGSSYGGLMAVIYALDNQEKVRKLILLAPALASGGFDPYLPKTTDIPVIIYHGRNDDVVPLGPVHDIARRVFNNLTFNIVEDNHVLSKTFTSIDWANLL